MGFASWKDRKPIAQALRAVYRADNAEAGMKALETFEQGHWGQRYPAITQSWRRHFVTGLKPFDLTDLEFCVLSGVNHLSRRAGLLTEVFLLGSFQH